MWDAHFQKKIGRETQAKIGKLERDGHRIKITRRELLRYRGRGSRIFKLNVTFVAKNYVTFGNTSDACETNHTPVETIPEPFEMAFNRINGNGKKKTTETDL